MDLISKSMLETGISMQQRASLVKLLEILNRYSFQNRIDRKGLLTHTIIDSLELDHSVGGELIRFDSEIHQ